ncbi:MAG: ribonuclease III [Prevotella sp.]|nr:ribonuclease III [Prevotella sp.]
MRLNDIIDRIKLPFREEKELFSSLYEVMGFYPHDISYYKQALMHKSIGRRNEKGKPLNNERLEFLGDALLDAVVGHIVYDRFPGKREGFLTNTRSKLVSRDTLGKLAEEMGLKRLILSSGHSNSHNSYMGGNAFEALVGAIYLDQGYDAVMRFMEKRILAKLINIDKVAYKEVNFKSKLLEWSQKNRVHMEFRMLKQGKDKESGSPIFKFQVFLEDIAGEVAQGFSKKEAQQLAAESTLQRLKCEPQFIDAIFMAKSDRTKMEEMPTMGVPDTETEQEFIIHQPEQKDVEEQESEITEVQKTLDDDDDFDLSDITASPGEPSREDIIAAAEAAAFGEQ